MNKGMNGQENKHLTVREIIEFLNENKYNEGIMEQSASTIFHLTNCEKCRETYDSLAKFDGPYDDLFGEINVDSHEHEIKMTSEDNEPGNI